MDHKPSTTLKERLILMNNLDEREKLFKGTVELCYRAKEGSRKTALMELVDVVSSRPELIFCYECVYEEMRKIFEVNVSRKLPPSSNQNGPKFDPEEDKPSKFRSLTCTMHLIYDLMYKFLNSPELKPNLAKACIDARFVLQLFRLLNSEDSEERDHVKSALITIYEQFGGLRSYIRRQINNIFYRFIYETENHNGIAELLELLESIIDGFASPLEAEHKVFLLKVLMPLHKTRSLNVYHSELTGCVEEFLEKDESLTKPVIRSMLKYWPKVHKKNEEVFLESLKTFMNRL